MAKKKRWPFASYVAIPRQWINSRCPEWTNLSLASKMLYVYLKAGYNLANNGQIKLPYSRLKSHKGISHPRTISRSIKELEKAGFIKRTKPGGLYHGCSEYELTGKFDPYL